MYLDGFPQPIRIKIARRLEFTAPNVVPSDGYDLDVVHASVSFIFAAGAMSYDPPSVAAPRAASPASDQPSLKDLINAMSSMTQSVHAALRQTSAGPSHPPPSRVPLLPAPGGAVSNPPRWDPSNAAPAPQGCVFCSAPEHYIRECPVIADYQRRGMVNRNENGKIVLPDGRFPPRTLPGKNMKERIDSFWESQNIRGKDTVSTNFLETDDDYIFALEASAFDNPPSEEPSADEQIQVLQAQIESLRNPKAAGGARKAKFDGVEITRKVGPPAEAR